MIVQVTSEGLNRAYELRVGDELVLRLKENPTAGFRWQVGLSDQGALVPLDDRFEPGATSPLPGAGGHRVLRFSAVRAGTVQMSLANRRAWEPDAGDKDHLSIVIR